MSRTAFLWLCAGGGLTGQGFALISLRDMEVRSQESEDRMAAWAAVLAPRRPQREQNSRFGGHTGLTLVRRRGGVPQYRSRRLHQPQHRRPGDWFSGRHMVELQVRGAFDREDWTAVGIDLDMV